MLIVFVTYYRRTQLLAGPNEEDGSLWLQELRMKRPLVEAVRRDKSAGTTRSISQPTPHLVSYTTANNVKIAILSNSPDQQQYQDPAAAWRRIFKHMDSGHAGSAAGSTVAHQLEMERNSQSRKQGRPMGTKYSCSKPKAIRGVKARRTETTTVEGQSNPLPQVDCNANHNYTNTNSNDNATFFWKKSCIKLSKQRKHRFSKRMWPYGRGEEKKHTHTSKVSSERSLRYLMNWNFPSPTLAEVLITPL